jgi:two-component system, chemotaxis family, chemotaxis protein CheY
LPPPDGTWAAGGAGLRTRAVLGSANLPEREKKTVLLIEDDDDVREAVEQILIDEGFRVVAASDGGVALDVLAQGEHRFCTIILDVLMPGVDGAEFLARARDRLRSIPVLLFSASQLPGHLRNDPQVKDLIPKPVEVEVLLEKIRAHCG